MMSLLQNSFEWRQLSKLADISRIRVHSLLPKARLDNSLTPSAFYTQYEFILKKDETLYQCKERLFFNVPILLCRLSAILRPEEHKAFYLLSMWHDRFIEQRKQHELLRTDMKLIKSDRFILPRMVSFKCLLMALNIAIIKSGTTNQK